jgi:transposase-like protein
LSNWIRTAKDGRFALPADALPGSFLCTARPKSTFSEEHWRRIRTNNPLERILREIRRRTRVVGSFPDGQSALNLAAARLRYIAGTAWSTKPI